MLQPEQVLHDRYQLKHKLGQNAGRQTWLAEDLTTQPAEPVIVKLLAFSDQIHWDALRLFEREAQILKQLNHAQIPKYRDYFSIDDRILWFGLVQDYIPGASLKELLTQGKRFTEPQIRQLAINILHILTYLHELTPPVLHRDIKPGNLIWGDDNYIYLVDFGAVQDQSAMEGASFTVVGTYGYTPMEQFGGRAVPASDLYALGATLIHLLTGTAPADLPQRNLHIQFTDRVSLSPTFARWIATLTEPDQTKRFSSTHDALEGLQRGRHPASKFDHLDSEAPTAGHSLHRPANTPIEIRESLEKLSIQCAGLPNSTFKLWLGLMMLFAATGMSVATLFPAIPLFFVGTLFALTGAWDAAATLVQFDRRRFVISKKLLGFTIPLSVGAISDIEDVFHHNLQVNPGKASQYRVVTIQTDNNDYSFGQGLTREACSWLAQTIKNWLKLL